MIRRKHIREVADNLLAEHGIQSVPVPVERIANSLSVQVQRERAEDELSGFIFRAPNRQYAIIGVNALHPKTRQAFTIAHELGHFLLHDHHDPVHVDRKFPVRLRDEKSSLGTDIEEREANLFAAELLMPVNFVEQDVKKIDSMDLEDESTLKELAKRYGVSTQAMTIRLMNLGHINL